jgi:hypothetical protein
MAVASDAGSGRVLAPVLQRLARSGTALIAYASGPSAGILPREAPEVTTITLDDDSTAEKIGELIASSGARVVMTGAGCYNQLEHAARLAARQSGRQSVAVLDYWFEYGPRFHRTSGEQRIASWPDVVCVPDETAARGIAEAGGDPGRVVVTGSPNLEASRQWWRTNRPSREQLAESLDVPPAGPIVVFFSEPYRANPDGRPLTGAGGLCREDGTPIFGYTAERMLRLVAEALAHAARPAGRCIQLLVKPHPLEWVPPLSDFARNWSDDAVRVRVIETAHPRDLVAVADAVVGMSSVTLIESGLAGRPTYSVQIGLDASAPFDPCVANRLGLATPILDAAALAAFAAAVAARALPPPVAAPDGVRVDGAAEAVAGVVSRMLAVA